MGQNTYEKPEFDEICETIPEFYRIMVKYQNNHGNGVFALNTADPICSCMWEYRQT